MFPPRVGCLQSGERTAGRPRQPGDESARVIGVSQMRHGVRLRPVLAIYARGRAPATTQRDKEAQREPADEPVSAWRHFVIVLMIPDRQEVKESFERRHVPVDEVGLLQDAPSFRSYRFLIG